MLKLCLLIAILDGCQDQSLSVCQSNMFSALILETPQPNDFIFGMWTYIDEFTEQVQDLFHLNDFLWKLCALEIENFVKIPVFHTFYGNTLSKLLNIWYADLYR